MIKRPRAATPMRRSRANGPDAPRNHGQWPDTDPYTATAGTLTIRDDERQADGQHLLHRLHRRRRAERQPAGDVLLQRRAGLRVAVAAHGLVRRRCGCRPATRIYPPGAVQLRRQSGHPARRDRPGLHRRARRPAIRARSATPRARFLRRRPGRRRLRPRHHALRRPVGRWDSPKFLFGESYGTTRSARAGLSAAGSRHGAQRRRPAVVDHELRPPPAGPRPRLFNYLPSYAATAWYHHKMANPPATVEQAAAEAAPSPRAPMPQRSKRARRSARRSAIDRAADERADRPLAATSSSARTCASTCRASARSCCATSA